MSQSEVLEWLERASVARLDERGRAWLVAARAELEAGVSDARFATLLSVASRHARRRSAELSAAECDQAAALVEGWDPAHWSVLDLVRATLVLSRPDLESEGGPRAILEAFRYGDVGELCALARTLQLLPQPEAYVWQAGECCRSNMNEVFEAMACDNAFPAKYFDDVAWRALVVKAIFISAPLARVWGLDTRLSEDLARMALDLAEERRSAGREVQPVLWMCLGTHGGERALASIELELSEGGPVGRRAAALALARAGLGSRLAERAASEADPEVAATMRAALDEIPGQAAYLALTPSR
jgi:hypothetical protein